MCVHWLEENKREREEEKLKQSEGLTSEDRKKTIKAKGKGQIGKQEG